MALRCTVVSFVPFEILAEKPGLVPPRFKIEKSNMHVPTLLKVETASHFVYLDESRGMLQVKDPADIVAAAIVNDYINSQLGVDEEAGPALFYVDEDLKLKDFEESTDLKIRTTRALMRQRKWFVNICKMADDDWRKYHQHTVISDFQRLIGEVLELDPKEHEWMSPLSMLTDEYKSCPFCQTSVPKDATVCATCSHVIDPKRHKELAEALQA